MDRVMFKAARDGDVADLLELLEADPLILERCVTASSDSPLHVAAMLGHLGFVKEVIRHKLNVVEYVNEMNQEGYSSIHLAAVHGHVDVVRMLIEISSELCCLEGRDGMTPLLCASGNGRIETMILLLSASPLSVLEVTHRGETALHIAARNNQLDALRVLLEFLQRTNNFGVINSKDDEGNTVLHLASVRKNRQVIELLLSCNDGDLEVLEVNAINKRCMTTLDFFILCSCESGILHAEAERLLRGIRTAGDETRLHHSHNQVSSHQKKTLGGKTSNTAAPLTSSEQEKMHGDEYYWDNWMGLLRVPV